MSVDELQRILDSIPPLDFHEVDIDEALGHVLYEDIHSPEDLPPFSRSTMDGYAVRAKDTFGASESEPALLEVIGHVHMGQDPEGIVIGPGEAARIWTGGMLPEGADAVVMQEFVEPVDQQVVQVLKGVAPFENLILKGDDIAQGEKVLSRGKRLRPQDLGILAGLGITSLKVYKRPKVAVISTGDELVSPDKMPGLGKIRDINTTTLKALCQQADAKTFGLGIARDELDELKDLCKKAVEDGANIVLISGGSSVGRRDFTLEVLSSLPESRILCSGVSIKPGKPTIVAVSKDTVFFGLPGHVASAIVVFYLFVRRAILRMSGQRSGLGLPKTRARIIRNLPSSPGREEYVRVDLEKDQDGKLVAIPIFGKSGLISPLVRAKGLLLIPCDCEGLYEGEEAEVMLFP